ncbi:hypothetical protein B0H34DRAFT_794137 [Crassisporium funariophilum]|nr:hypothetical protein B0H34DRAFT_794137 [Crassisporium funariophilum]
MVGRGAGMFPLDLDVATVKVTLVATSEIGGGKGSVGSFLFTALLGPLPLSPLPSLPSESVGIGIAAAVEMFKTGACLIEASPEIVCSESGSGACGENGGANNPEQSAAVFSATFPVPPKATWAIHGTGLIPSPAPSPWLMKAQWSMETGQTVAPAN